MNKSQTRWITVGAAILVLAGCATLTSTKVDTSKDPEKREGIAYCLPRARIIIKAVRIDDKPTPAKNNSTNETKTTSTSPNNPQSVDANAADTNQPPPYYEVTMQAIYEPDGSNMFLLNPRLRCTSDDTFQIAVSNGLLMTISSTNIDQSGEVLVQLAKIGIEGFKLAAGVPSTGAKRAGKNQYPKQIEVSFDPSIESERTAAVKAFDKFGYTDNDSKTNPLFKLTVDPPQAVSEKWSQLTDANGHESNGFFYRSVLPYKFTLANGQEGSTVSKVFLLPNGAPILSWSLKRAALVKCINRVTLENGMLKEIFVDKPSTALATVKVPLTILQSIVSLPTDLIQLKVNYSTANKSLLESQKAEITSMQALLDAQRKFLEFQTTNSPSADSGH